MTIRVAVKGRYDLGSRFARLHLRTRAERAVYLVLVCDRTKAWSPEEIARLAFPNVSSAASRLSHDATTGTRRDGGGLVPRASVSRVRIGDVPATSWVTGASRGA